MGTVSQENSAFAHTPPKRETSGDNERTPTGMPILSPVMEGVKKSYPPRSSFRSRRPKPLIMCMKRKRSGMLRKTGITKIIETVVKKEMKGFENIINSVSTTIKQEVLSAVQQQMKESLEGFRDVLETVLEKSRRSKAKSKCSINERKFAAIEMSCESDMEPDKVVPASTAVEDISTSSTEKSPKADGTSHNSTSASLIDEVRIKEEIKTPSPAKRSTGFGALLKYVHSKTLLEKLTASMEKNRKDTKNNDIKCATTLSGSIDEGIRVKKEVPPPVSQIISLDRIKQEPQESFFEETIIPNNAIVPTTSVSRVQPIRNIERRGGPTSNNACKALVPYVRTSSVATKIIIRIPKLGPELIPKPELNIRKYKEPLSCDYCGKHFYNNSSLKQHTSFHRPHRPFQCEHTNCNKAYKTRSELNRHLVVHSGEKNYECRQCGKRFLRKQYLKTHLLRHEEALIWNCNLCSKLFVTQHDLDKHKVSYHKNGKRALRSDDEQPKRLALTSNSSDLHA